MSEKSRPVNFHINLALVSDEEDRANEDAGQRSIIDAQIDMLYAAKGTMAIGMFPGQDRLTCYMMGRNYGENTAQLAEMLRSLAKVLDGEKNAVRDLDLSEFDEYDGEVERGPFIVDVVKGLP